ncbi:MAG: NAD(P)(+) transhydrogenase (Re/Si-specific) subunit beta [Rhodospirillaceae bacterium]|jgi:H+-translocating NAD(P) transhydrogenase subunit beta|nr:NAD(P)(+) transhydrogenase (Re/Si-specific) subunit beta [Rhodospirillaceae bacterium]MBT5194843.1 NAD(P)(+) transhydrogenase (Re/Si-specific) subunit beta [Rhodospirillaceae bacterium]MBT5895491.1 NAD(P)(+) transhydrogenase (Re/Si-specific) subunit beta [Rhodospirillaceae bacterium]MBT6428173.1 NAD(P)(+) transhydrogenase (Re/Si-specific) subunit beta [Rhodospirillaceae bacterium]MBT7029407.1 NAD(P)(+) transhydrogenase (Re/Si-specific) subunit beta [Rhodospirillaceae bacterium]
MSANLTALAYLIASVLFIMALRGLSSPESSRSGNVYGMIGMAIAVVTTVINPNVVSYEWILVAMVVGGAIGAFIARRIAMTDMPQLVAAFHSLVGLAAVLVAAAAFYNPGAYGIAGVDGALKLASRIEMGIGVVIGAITFSGSIIAFGKLQGVVTGNPITFPAQHALNAGLGAVIVLLVVLFAIDPDPQWFWAMTVLAFILGFLLIIPIGGADMPVIVSMLNSYSGWAAAGIGFTLENTALIITGALVGSSGAILSYIMCKAMNRSFISVLLGGFGGDTVVSTTRSDKPVKAGSAEDAAFIMKNASSVIIVPGYGMAVAQAQHSIREMGDMLKGYGVKVTYAIHPVAGRMPGHMNVLLAEANVSYDEVFELEEINSDFSNTDVAFVIGANDVTNPAAHEPGSPIAGMPILDVDRARTCLFVKRSLSPGYAGIDNELFYADNTMMLFADAKKMVEDIVKAL